MQIIKSSLFILLITVTSPVTFAQFSWSLDAESGIFMNRNFGISDQAWGANLNGKLGYKLKAENRLARFSFRAKPELYDIGNKITSLKLKATVEYYQFEENLTWSLKIDGNRFNYNLTGTNYQTNSVFLIGEISANIISGIKTLFNAGYSNRSIETEDEITMDLVFADVLLRHNLSEQFNFGYGLYFEKFTAKNVISSQFQTSTSTKGIRYGPQLTLSLNSEFIVRASYNFLIHDSEETEYFSTEHQLSFICGKNIFRYVSILAYLTYYSANLKYNETPESERLYFQSNFENTVYLKLSYDVSENLEFYFKPGYRKIELSYQSGSIEEWHLLLGLGISM